MVIPASASMRPRRRVRRQVQAKGGGPNAAAAERSEKIYWPIGLAEWRLRHPVPVRK
jgi:hypothetical protein